MAETLTPLCDFGLPAPDFSLRGVDGKTWTLEDCRGPRGLLVMFICNHCPFVKAINPKLVRDTNDLARLGVNSVAIMPNDYDSYPADSFENMQAVAREQGYPFPYLLDDSQDVARAYGAVCTPDFFGYNANLELQYRGRLDASGRHQTGAELRRDLFEGMREVAETGKGPENQLASIGCSIKWRNIGGS